MIMGSDVRADREIIDDILNALRKAGAGVGDVRIYVLIEALRETKHLGPSSGNRKSNKEYAEKVNSWIDAGERMFADPPEGFPLNYLFSPPDDSLLADPTIVSQKPEQCNDWLLTAVLADMRRRCKSIIEHRVGEHGRSGYQQERAARVSRELLKTFGVPLHPSSPTSTYRMVASLFFEAMTGTYGADLERACKAMVKSRLRTRTKK
jgi:hypothetical protein